MVTKSFHIKLIRLAVLVLSWAVLFGAAGLVPAHAQSDQDRALKARQEGAVDLPALRRMVEQRYGGRVVGVNPRGSGKNLRYSFNVLRGAEVLTVTVNARTGAVTNVKEPKR